MGRSNARAPFLLLLAIGGCIYSEPGAVDDARPQLWTLFDLREALAAGTPVAAGASFPQGIAPQETLAPADGAQATLKIIPAFSEGQPAAYVMPEIWSGFDEVWVQPWYVLVTAWDAKSPSQNRAKGADGMNAPPVFDVGPRSLFYSPLWLDVLRRAARGRTRRRTRRPSRSSTSGLAIYPGVAVDLSPSVPTTSGWATRRRSSIPSCRRRWPAFSNERPVRGSTASRWRTSTKGANNFTYRTACWWSTRRRCYELARRGPDGAPPSLGAPRVMGSGPPFARRPADAPGRAAALRRLQPDLPSAVAPATAARVRSRRVARRGGAADRAGINPADYRRRTAGASRRDVACFAASRLPGRLHLARLAGAHRGRLGRRRHRRHRGQRLHAAGVLWRQGDRTMMPREAPAPPALRAAVRGAGRRRAPCRRPGRRRAPARPAPSPRPPRAGDAEPGRRRAGDGAESRGRRVRPAGRHRDRAARCR